MGGEEESHVDLRLELVYQELYTANYAYVG